MSEIAEPSTPAAPAAWWRRLWANPAFHGIVMMLLEIAAFLVFSGLLAFAFHKLIPLPPIPFEKSVTEPGPNVYLRALRDITPIVLGYWLMVRLLRPRNPGAARPAVAITHVAYGYALGTAILVVAALAMAAVGVLHWQGGADWSAPLLGPFVVLGLGPGIREEIVSRGVLLGAVERGFGTWAAIVVSALVFGLGHYGNPNATWWSSLAIAVEAGLLLGMAYVWTRSLWFVMALHAAWNFTQGPLLGIPVSGLQIDGLLDASASGPELLSGGPFGAEASVLTVVLCVGVAAWFTRKAIADGKLVRASWNRPRYPSPPPVATPTPD